MHDRDRLFMLYGRKLGDAGARVDLRMVAFFGVVLLLLALAGWLYLRQASEVAQLASEIRELELEKEARHREIVILRGEVATLGSLKRVLVEGSEMGYRLPAASSDEGLLIVPCATDCTPPSILASEVEGTGSDTQQDTGGLWAGVGERVRRGIRLAFPTW